MTCPVCASSQFSQWGFREFPIFECLSCHATFFERNSSKADYEDYGTVSSAPQGYTLEYDLNLRRPKYRKQLERISRYTTGRELLDIGASGGGFCLIAKEHGWNARGVELSSKARAIGESLGISYVDLESVEDESVDVITCFHVLEHIPDTAGFLRTLYSKLKPNGLVVAHVPHQEPLSFAIRNRIFPAKETYCQLYSPEHLTGFTVESLTNAFELQGFRPLRVVTRSMWSFYYDPFFVKLYVKRSDYIGIAKHSLRCAVDNLGVLFNRGDWVIGYFRKPA